MRTNKKEDRQRKVAGIPFQKSNRRNHKQTRIEQHKALGAETGSLHQRIEQDKPRIVSEPPTELCQDIRKSRHRLIAAHVSISVIVAGAKACKETQISNQ